MKELKLHYSEALVRRAVRSFWWRVTGWLYVIAILLMLFSFSAALLRGDRSWWVGAIGTALVLGIIFGLTLYLVHIRGSLSRFRRMRIPEATLAYSEEGFRITSDVGSSELAWSAVTELWRFDDFWLLFLSKAQFITLPAADLDAEVRDFMLHKAQACGTKVR
jgi:hypothetical protein